MFPSVLSVIINLVLQMKTENTCSNLYATFDCASLYLSTVCNIAF